MNLLLSCVVAALLSMCSEFSRSQVGPVGPVSTHEVVIGPGLPVLRNGDESFYLDLILVRGAFVEMPIGLKGQVRIEGYPGVVVGTIVSAPEELATDPSLVRIKVALEPGHALVVGQTATIRFGWSDD